MLKGLLEGGCKSGFCPTNKKKKQSPNLPIFRIHHRICVLNMVVVSCFLSKAEFVCQLGFNHTKQAVHYSSGHKNGSVLISK